MQFVPTPEDRKLSIRDPSPLVKNCELEAFFGKFTWNRGKYLYIHQYNLYSLKRGLILIGLNYFQRTYVKIVWSELVDKFTTRWENIHVQRGTFQIYEGMFQIDPLFLDGTGKFLVKNMDGIWN